MIRDQEEADRDDEEPLDAAPFRQTPEEPGCPSACVLPLRWGLNCRNGVWPSAATDIAFSVSLIHPRRHVEPLAEFSGAWSMSWVPAELSVEEMARK